MKPIFHQIPSNSGSSEADEVFEPLKDSWPNVMTRKKPSFFLHSSLFDDPKNQVQHMYFRV